MPPIPSTASRKYRRKFLGPFMLETRFSHVSRQVQTARSILKRATSGASAAILTRRYSREQRKLKTGGDPCAHRYWLPFLQDVWRFPLRRKNSRANPFSSLPR